MRRSKYVSKKLAVVLMSAALGVTPVVASVAMPVSAFAAELPDNEGGETISELENGDTIENNDGKIETNDGEILNNNGTVEKNTWIIENNNGEVDENLGFITTNSNVGTVSVNNKEITDNFGIVSKNNLVIKNNHSFVEENNDFIQTNVDGVVSVNNGGVGLNDGHIIDNYNQVENIGGKITNNREGGEVFGGSFDPDDDLIGNGSILLNIGGAVYSGFKPEDIITIDNYYYGELSDEMVYNGETLNFNGTIYIINSYGEESDTNKDFVMVENQYHALLVNSADNVDVTFNGFTEDEVNKFQYVKTAENGNPIEVAGTITLKAKDGYAISDNGQLSGNYSDLGYALSKNDDGSYTLYISSLKGTVAFTPELLNLIVSKVSTEHGEVKNVVVDKGGSSDNRSDNASEPSAPATFNFNDIAIKSIADQVQAQMNIAGQDVASLEVVDIYFKDKINMTPDIIKYLCEKVPVAKRCHFDYQGEEWVLTIPAFDTTSPAYAEGLEVLDKEPAKTAGFLRIKDIFKALKFDAKIVEVQTEETVQD
ncbi:hypothetical protein D6856_14330 [Butyrivibrio sp. XB500-5]|uniref:hypothetical protein n=1 Tax=Butyrivibrio sp. XB500-5 TaxID=2364880 RepID=UPI000EA99D8E|nr:hypothetical protein [Butyrivibrio sp. XB500-5]RKM56950.1 hypothetical protein D6856_14330 [Butyrivibrio sp. XB500-5]